MFSIIITQIVKMLLILFVGILCSRLNLIDDHANKGLANLLLLVVNPIVTFMAMQADYEPELVTGLLISFALAIATHLLMIPVANLLIKKEGNSDCAIERFAVIYSNCGFFGIPLVQSILGSEGVLYLTAYMTVFNVFSWTHGLGLMTQDSSEKQSTSVAASAKTLLKNLCTPMIFACTIGLILFALQIKLPNILSDTLNIIGNMNTPLAMIIAGVSVAQTNIFDILKNRRIYLVTFAKLLIMPAIVFVILLLVKVDSTVAYTILVASACPCAATGTAFALKYQKNYAYSSEIYAFSTLCSLVTIPAFVFVAERLL
ncbi:MAG: AEC family transporter [Clostridiales bacterium]|nr:AEC family transporter [Clostridiales bacterium]MCC8105487.1 AEC family transporter [Clostridiales bacterium]